MSFDNKIDQIYFLQCTQCPIHETLIKRITRNNDAWRIHKDHLVVVCGKNSENFVARGLRLFRHNRHFLADQAIEQR